jgi:hypothetical protein
VHPFRTKLNPLVPLGRFLFALFFLALGSLVAYLAWQQSSWKDGLAFACFGAFCFYLGFVFARGLLTQTRNYYFTPEELVVTNYLPHQIERFCRAEIEGYSCSLTHLRIGTFRQITLHISPHRRFTLPQFSYWNFKSLELALAEYQIPEIKTTQVKG